MGTGRFSVEAVFRAVDRMTAPVARMGSAVSRMAFTSSLALDRVDRAVNKMHSGIKRAGFMVGGAAAAAGAGVIKLGRAGYEFEQAMSAVGAVGLETREQVKDLEMLAMKLGSSTVFTATEVANAMEAMKRAGFSNADVMTGIPGVLDAAAAEGLEIADAAEIVSASLKGMGLETSEAARVADVLALASSKTKSTMGTLGESLSNVSSTARTLGIPLEQVVASVGLLQDVGIDASTAGTSLKTALTRLTKPTKQVTEALSRVGLSTKSFKDASGNMLPLGQVLQRLSDGAAKAGGNFDRVAFFARIFGLESQESAGNLVRLFDTGQLGKLTTELEGAAGSAAKMAKIRLDNLSGDVEQLGGAFDALKIKIFDTQRGPLRGLVQGWTQWIEANDSRIVAESSRFFSQLLRELPEIVEWVKIGGKVLLGFYGAAGIVKAAVITRSVFNGAATAVKATGTAAAWAATKVGLLDAATLSAGKGFGGLRGALNATALAGKINGVTSLMGKAGLWGAAAAVGVAIGSWLNSTFGLDKKIEDLAAKLFGLDDAINNAGGRTTKRGIQGSSRYYATGEVMDEYGRARDADVGARLPHVSPASIPGGASALPAFDAAEPIDVSPLVHRNDMSAQALARELRVQLEQSQIVEVNVNTSTGKVDVTRSPSRTGARGSLRQPRSGDR